jgi:hypothetical protein
VPNPYLDLTEEFNRGALRVLLSSGQAVVVHRLAIMSKDGDWIVREHQDALDHVLAVLGSHGARYRFGAPLDLRWLRGGWSSHFEYPQNGLRIRCDFVSRPPRIASAELSNMWSHAEASGRAVVEPAPLAAIKLTNREKDYAVVGELARIMTDPVDQLRFSRSARDLLGLAGRHPTEFANVRRTRPALAAVELGQAALEEALDRERRDLIRANEARLQRYQVAAEPWEQCWPQLQRDLAGLSVDTVPARVCAAAAGVLPFEPVGASP